MNCSGSDYGGAIYCRDSVVSGCCFVNCSANYDGGAIYIMSGSVSGCPVLPR